MRFDLEMLVSDALMSAIRSEAASLTTRQNVEQALPFLREALDSGLGLTAVCKWYHRRALHLLRELLPDVPALHAVSYDPIYDGVPLTRSNWWRVSPVAAERVL